MHQIAEDARFFQAAARARRATPAQIAALSLVGGIDLEKTLRMPERQRLQVALRLARLIERERLKGAAQHWSYDLNRHIALTQAMARLRDPAAGGADGKLHNR